MSELPDWVKPGARFKYNFPTPEKNVNHGRKFEVRGIVDGMAVIREWWRNKGRYNYTVEGWWYFDAFGDRIVQMREQEKERSEK